MHERALRFKESVLTVLTLITSSGTLICCALPVLLVSLGLGAAVAGLTSALPWLITLSLHKVWIFALSGILLILSGWLTYRPGRACPTDPKLARLCNRLDGWNRILYSAALVIWGLGFFAAFLLLPIREWVGW